MVLRKPANTNETTELWRVRALEDAVEALDKKLDRLIELLSRESGVVRNGVNGGYLG